jgi:para-nitrobenzyl esterase
MTVRDPLAKIEAGELRGREREGALLFAGIPFAAPVTGPRRWAPPAVHPGWSGVLDAQRFGRAAPQRPGTGPTATPLAWDEDCLTLNVTTPAIDDARRPVLVWIHGGAFVTGKGGIPWYDGSAFATRGDIVTVTINYRLGALGFTHLAALDPSLASAGLLGSLDQIAALEWVRANIAAFGGDPECVTVAGESAGAMSVGALLGMPRARGLFHRVIAQSGACHHVSSIDLAEDAARVFLDAAGHPDSVAALRALEVESILDAQERTQAALSVRPVLRPGRVMPLAFQPVIDGDTLPAPPLDAVRAGACRDVPLLVGSNADETTLFGYHRHDAPRLQRLAANVFPDGEAALDTYRRARPGCSTGELATAITTDQLFRMPATRLCEAQSAAGGTAYAYRFDWKSRAFGGALGATHALEIPFAFHTLDRPGVGAFLGRGGHPEPLADAMHAAWTAFIRVGDPACEALGTAWPGYDADTRSVLAFGDTIETLADPASEERQLWNDIL